MNNRRVVGNRDRMGARVKQAGVQRGLATLVCEGPLAPFGDELKVMLMKSRIRDGL